MGEEELAPVVKSRPSSQTAFYAILAVLVVATAVLVDLNYGTPAERLVFSEVVIIWGALLLIYFIFNRPFVTGSERFRKTESWLSRWLYTTNHKDIGTLYIVTSLFYALVGGVLAELMRTQLMVPQNNFLNPLEYNEAVTLHGLLMIFWFLSPFALGFANYFVPLQIKAKDLAFPRLNALSYWTFAFSGLLMILAFFLPGGNINGGWTLYSPLTANTFMPGPGPTLGFAGFTLMVGSITIGSINFVVTIIAERAPGVTWSKIPMFTWFMLFTIVQMLFAFPSLLGGLLMLLADRLAGTIYFTSVAGGSLLWDNLFWFFGHPEVYIVLLPAFGAICEVLPVFARKRLFGKNAILVATFALVVPFSFLVWGHHMFTTPIPPTEKMAFMVSTMGISLPFDVIVIAWLITITGGSLRLKTPLLFTLAAIVVFIIGGIAGVFLASVPLDMLFRGSYFVVAHFHYVMVGASVFGLFAAFYYWFPKMTGRMYNEALGKLHFVLSMIGFNLLYFPMFFLLDMPRRIVTYNVPSWALPNFLATIGAYIFGPVQFILVANFLYSMRKGAPAPANPWDADTPEWETEILEEVNGGYTTTAKTAPTFGLGVGSSSSIAKTPSVEALRNSTQVSTTTQVGPQVVVRHHVSTRPITLAGGLAVALLGLAMLQYAYLGLPILGVGATLAVMSIVGWAWDDMNSVFRVPEGLVEKWPFAHVSRLKLGMWSLIFSDIILFGAILASDAYIRINSSTWPAPNTLHPIVLGAISTFILLSSSPSAYMALDSIRRGSTKGMLSWLGVTFSLGAIFDGFEFYEWWQLFSQKMFPSTSNALTTYFFTVGIHATHVLIGLFIMVYLIIKGLKGGFTKNNYEAVELFGIYWSFVDALWVFIFAFFFLL
ncbi:MAG: cbb3-type cytochrome c oxidase subunit I [Thermoprotei archaeon]